MEKKRYSKVLLGFLIAVGFALIGMTSSNVYAEDGEAKKPGDFNYSLINDDKEICINGLKYPGDTVVNIPEAILNLPVTKINDGAFQYNRNITEVVIPDSVREIGESAFVGCNGITYFTIPVDVKTNNSFDGCLNVSKIKYTYGKSGKMTDRKDDSSDKNNHYAYSLEWRTGKLTTIEFGEGISYIGSLAFYNRTGLVKIINSKIWKESFLQLSITGKYRNRE